MFYAAYRDQNGVEHRKLYFSYPEYFRDTFSPLTEHLACIPFRVSGKTYAEKRESVRKQAACFQSAFAYGNLSYGEMQLIQEWFSKQGGRFGLIREFRENAIC